MDLFEDYGNEMMSKFGELYSGFIVNLKSQCDPFLRLMYINKGV